jgi:signal transduction histidine kinase
VTGLVVHASRSLKREGRLRVCAGAALAALLLSPAATAAATSTAKPVRREIWKARRGDDPRWARPGHDDAAWRKVPLPATWRELGYGSVDGMIWFRRVATLDAEARRAARDGRLGLLLGPTHYGGYQVYAGGRLLGSSRSWSRKLPRATPEVFPVPREAVGKNGEIPVALRVRRLAWMADRRAESGPVGATLTFGSYPALRNQVDLAWSRTLLADLPVFVLCLLFLVVAPYHLLLYLRRRRQQDHLWFGLLALAFAANTFASSYWVYTITGSFGVAVRVSDLTGHLAAALAIQFLWTFFSRPIARWLRVYQLSHVAIAVFIGLWPSVEPVILSQGFRLLWLLPLLVAAATLVLREAWRGQAEARFLAVGGAVMIAVEVADLAIRLLGLPWTGGVSLAPFGFAVVLVAMGTSLSSRFRRIHDELDHLRLSLEEQVRKRTAALLEAKDEALAASRTKSEFLTNVSHELRTPLNGVLGMTYLLGETPLTEEQKTYLDMLQTSGDALLALVTDILDFSEMKSGMMRIESVPFRLAAVIEQALEIVAPLAARQGIVLGHTVAEGTPQALIGDHARTHQVLVNLLGNAVKFTLDGEVHVFLTSRTLGDGRIEAHFSVTDTGIGITPEDLGRLFAAFHPLDNSLSRKRGGTGIGLAICKALTELMGGVIWVESTAGKGSTFHFTIVGEAVPLSLWPPAAVDRNVAQHSD